MILSLNSLASKLFTNMSQTSQTDAPSINADSVSVSPTNTTNNNNTSIANTEIQSSESVKSILKPESLSLEPKDKRVKSNSNTPRKVQFQIIEGQQFGGHGQTEFSKTPQRKSHTKKQLPIGIFDTESNTDDTLSDIEENSAKRTNTSSSLLDNINSKKFMANSRLVRLVKRKKKRKEKEERWLTMISPDVGLYNNQKTVSRIQSNNNNNVLTNITNNVTNINNTNNDRFKSPSQYMSRGRRAWYKAQKQMNNKTENNNNNIKVNKKCESTLRVPCTPIHKKVNDIVMRMNAHKNECDGNDGDKEDNDDILMNNNNSNNGSIPPEFITNDINNNISELFTHENTEMDMKDNSHQNSVDEDEDNSDEMKVDNNNNNNNVGVVHNQDESEDDDLVLNNLQNKFMPKAKGDTVFDDMNGSGGVNNNTEVNNNKNENININNIDPIPIQNDDNNKENNRDEMMQSQSPSQDVNVSLSFNITSPMRYNNQNMNHMSTIIHRNNCNKSNNIQFPQSPTPNLCLNNNNNNNNNVNNINRGHRYYRSIGTQTEQIQCEIGIQTDMNNTQNMNAMSINSQFALMNGKPHIIISSNGTKYVRFEENINNMHENEENNQELPSVNNGSIDNDENIILNALSELTQIMSIYHKYAMIGPYDFNQFVNENKGQNWCCGNQQCTNNTISTYWVSTKRDHNFYLCNVCAIQKPQKAPNVNENRNNNHNNIQQLQSLSLNIENIETAQNGQKMIATTHKNIINTRSRTRLKRKYNETMPMNDENNMYNNIIKRRKMNAKITNKSNNSRIRYQKQDIIWTSYNRIDEVAIIMNCQYSETEKFYPSKYELLWLNWTDTTDDNNRKGMCSITTESYDGIKSYVNEKELDQLFKTESVSNNGWKEIKKHRIDIYNRYFDATTDIQRILQTNKMRRKRRASVM